MKKVSVILSFLCGMAGLYFTPALRAMPDTIPPVVVSVDPLNGEIFVSPTTDIEIIISDPDLMPDVPGSGIDMERISIQLNGEKHSFDWDPVGENSIRFLVSDHKPFPPLSRVSLTVDASDNTGNVMETFHSFFLTRKCEDDQSAPHILKITPPDGCLFIPPTAQVAYRLADYESGVDMSTLNMYVDDRPVRPDIYSTQTDYYCSYIPDMPFPFGSWVSVRVSVADYNGNTLKYEWSFQTKPPPVYTPELLSPENNALLNFQLEDGAIRFVWSFSPGDKFFRLYLAVDNTHSYQKLDLGPGDYELFGNRVEVTYPLTEAGWNEVAKLGAVRWSVAKIDGYSGNEISTYSDEFAFTLAPSGVVVLRSPPDKSIAFSQFGSPVFSWDPFDQAKAYYFGIMEVGSFGELVGDVLVFEVESEVNAFRFNDEEWMKFSDGRYVWTVMALLPGEEHSDCMNYELMKFGFSQAGVFE